MWTNVPQSRHEQYRCSAYVSICNGIALDIFQPVFNDAGQSIIECTYTVLKGMSTDILDAVGHQEYVNRLFQVNILDQIRED